MAHEITSTDALVLNSAKPAWHGLGLVLDQDLSPQQACDLVFPWTAIQQDIYRKGADDVLHQVPGYRMNVRSDNGNELGLVSDGYKIIQPRDMADFAEALVTDETVKVQVETAGSIRGGRRVWFLLRGEEFNVANGDKIFPYVLLSNGFDGGTSFRITPTTVRAVCSNTLHAIIPRTDKGELGSSAITISHTTNAMDRVKEAQKALAGYQVAISQTREAIKILSDVVVTKEQVQQFFIDCYSDDFGKIPEAGAGGRDAGKRDKAISAFHSFSKRFDDEREIAGCTWWNVANAYSGLLQHDLKARGRDDVARVERRVESNLFGLNSDRTQAAFGRAFKAATVG